MPLRLDTEELAELVGREDFDLLAVVVHLEASTALAGVPHDLCFSLLVLVPVDLVRRDGAAGDSRTGRAELTRVVRARQRVASSVSIVVEAVVVRVLVHHHRLVVDACLGRGASGPETWLISTLKVPARKTKRGATPEVPNVICRRPIVLAVSLSRELEVVSSRAAISTIPPPLVDSEAVFPVRVGEIQHIAPYVDIVAPMALP